MKKLVQWFKYSWIDSVTFIRIYFESVNNLYRKGESNLTETIVIWIMMPIPVTFASFWTSFTEKGSITQEKEAIEQMEKEMEELKEPL